MGWATLYHWNGPTSLFARSNSHEKQTTLAGFFFEHPRGEQLKLRVRIDTFGKNR